MKTRYQFFAISMLLGWLAATMILFMLANRHSYLHLFFPEQITVGQPMRFVPSEIPNFFSQMTKAMIGVLLFSSASMFGGALFFKWDKFSLIKTITAFTLGQILYSLFLLITVSAWQLEAWITFAILLAGTTSGLMWVGFWARPSLSVGFKNAKQSLHKIEIPRLLILFIIVFFTGITYACSRMGYDAVAYYFSHAKIMAITGEFILFYPKTAFAISDSHSSILFSAIIQTFGDQAARLLSWVNGGCILLTGWAIGVKAGLSTRARLFFVSLILTSTAFLDLLGDGKVELISTMPIVAALWWMLDSLQNPSRRRFLLVGALLGFAIISRPYNIFLVPVFTILFYLFQVFPVLQREGLAAAWHLAGPVFWIFPALLIVVAFHLWQNAFWLGSPFAPFTHAQSLDVDDWHWQFTPNALNALRLLYPLTVTFLNTPQSLGNISPLFIGVLPFLLLKNVRARFNLSAELRALLLPALITLLLWITLFFTVVEIRYIFFLWMLFFLFGAQVLEAAFEALEKRFQAILYAALTILLSFILIRTLVISLATYSPVDSNGRAHCYDIPFCAFLDPLNEIATEGERVFALNAYRYYLRPDLFACSSQAQEYAPLQTLANNNDGAFWAELYRQGFRYVTYEKNFAEFHSRFGTLPPPESAPEWVKVDTISSVGNQAVYRLQTTNPPFLPQKICSKTDNGTWLVTAK